jgi:hypothetical protein
LPSSQDINAVQHELKNARFWLAFAGLASLVSLGSFITCAALRNEAGLLASGIFLLWSLTGVVTLLVMRRKEKQYLRQLKYNQERG